MNTGVRRCILSVYKAIQVAELKMGSPPYLVDIAREWDKLILFPQLTFIVAALNELYRCDFILAD